MKRPDLRSLSNGAVVRRAAQGDERAWVELVDRFGPMVLHVARREGLSANDAKDVVQITWLRFVEHIHDLREPERVSAWLVTITRREASKALCAGRRQVPCQDLPDKAPAPDADPGRLIDQRCVADVVAGAMIRLSSRDRQLLFVLAQDDDARYKDIAQRVGIPIGSIGPTRSRCLAKLRKAPELARLEG